MAGRIDERLRTLGIELPEPQEPRVAKILGFRMANGLLLVSGQIPQWNGERRFIGKLGREFTTDEGREAARLSALNVLAVARRALDGDLDRVEMVMKLKGYVNATPDFIEIPEVVNGASELMIDIFGEAGRHARTAIGAAVMPFDVAIEIEGTFVVS